MLRCPFNNFSKCDGCCPFSTDNFESCLLADAAAATMGLQGAAKGIHQQLLTINALSTRVADATQSNADAIAKLADGLESLSFEAAPEESQRQLKPLTRERRDVSYLLKRGRNGYALMFSSRDAELIKSRFGETVGIAVIPSSNPRIVLYRGATRKFSRDEDTRKASVSVSAYTDELEACFGLHKYVYMQAEVKDGNVELVPTGETRD